MPRQTTRSISRATPKIAATIALSCALTGVARADCLDDAAAFQHVSVSLMRGIAQVESGMNPNAVNTNTNGTVDIGLMQINSTWLPTLAREGITRESLFDACTNAYVGAWILSQNIRQLGANWNAIGAYNSASPDKRLAYARKVYDAIRTMPDSPDTPMPILPPSFTPPQQAQAYNPFASLSVSAPPQVTRPRTISSAPPPPPPQGGPAGPAGSYNFGWTVTGADQAKPTQVFDDGARIYVQFSDMKHVPAIFTETSSGRVLMSWELQFPYAVLTRPAQTLIFQLGPFEARAQRSAGNGAGMTAQAGTGGAAAAAGSKKSANTAANAATNTAANPAAATATAAKRTASADALWYVNTPSTSGTAAASPSTANVPATLPTAITSNTPPPAPAQVPAAAAQPQPSRASADALWYISK
ncbi:MULTISPECIES: lytic transglycosylase domain-containing protein [Burkholderia]|uniref:Lytic transglycosylase n=1 Tax=Burkholderia contaminans TaxID=488447 RepID=A0A2S5DRU6_9BURK|nr:MULTISPECIES: transglycosylase SLT domain-containing protein [Burkholderia]EKS9794782.1 transglycosylase SLT domain-containing protein [Burkholderia cepacia]EKS9802737.1 transglycosylase SLT domain-containing protein [Burkholderia cepacia]EKS9809243.1 transglycosylase SLT domain-containing protein [Burkholderia cepacia]EKS9818104.1 transglycosylase SLT domain-containing protein [Burkholderia cepacia]EKS9824099.1 transglycosylase SLT domain-containing protein [Burkholderia cepacia]